MSGKDDDLLMEGAKRLRQLIQDKNVKANESEQSSDLLRGTTAKLAQNTVTTKTQNSGELDLSQATMEQLLAEIKARYIAVNLKADIKISIEPLEGGFLTSDLTLFRLIDLLFNLLQFRAFYIALISRKRNCC